MSKFKVGDLVTPSENEARSDSDITFGAKYLVTGVNGSDIIKFIDDDGDERYRQAGDYGLVTSWDTLKVGDILIDGGGHERCVQAVVGEIVFYSDYKDVHQASGWDTPATLMSEGWTIKQDSPTDETTELSVADLEEKLGLKAGTLRVKKD